MAEAELGMLADWAGVLGAVVEVLLWQQLADSGARRAAPGGQKQWGASVDTTAQQLPAAHCCRPPRTTCLPWAPCTRLLLCDEHVHPLRLPSHSNSNPHRSSPSTFTATCASRSRPLTTSASAATLGGRRARRVSSSATGGLDEQLGCECALLWLGARLERLTWAGSGLGCKPTSLSPGTCQLCSACAVPPWCGASASPALPISPAPHEPCLLPLLSQRVCAAQPSCGASAAG